MDAGAVTDPGIAARLDALSEQLAAIHQAQARGRPSRAPGTRQGKAGGHERDDTASPATERPDTGRSVTTGSHLDEETGEDHPELREDEEEA